MHSGRYNGWAAGGMQKQGAIIHTDNRAERQAKSAATICSHCGSRRVLDMGARHGEQLWSHRTVGRILKVRRHSRDTKTRRRYHPDSFVQRYGCCWRPVAEASSRPSGTGKGPCKHQRVTSHANAQPGNQTTGNLQQMRLELNCT